MPAPRESGQTTRDRLPFAAVSRSFVFNRKSRIYYG
jgi:hypothetical protein